MCAADLLYPAPAADDEYLLFLKRQLAGKDTFAADYRPPVGIKYTPNIIRAGVKVIDVAAALKNVYQPKPNELGYPDFRPTGVEDMLYSDPLLQVEGRWLLQGVQGLYLLGNDFRLKKTLFPRQGGCEARRQFVVCIPETGVGGYGLRCFGPHVAWHLP